MKTVITTDPREAAEILRRGGLLAVPTETVYGLAANGLDAIAVEEIYEVKGRPAIKPLSLMLPGPLAIPLYAEEVPEAAKVLAESFWPGPLTLVLKAKDTIPDIVRAGGDTIGLRCPDHPLTLELLREIGFPLAAPSANPSGLKSSKSADEVLGYFDGRIDGVLDGGPCGLGTESTILDLSRKPYRILRRGALPEEAVADALVERMTVFGITGGSGSGKTTALRVLRGLGAMVIDADAVYHELLRSDESLLDAISVRFPGTVREHTLDRKALAAAVFSDPEALSDLNAITHPAVIDETKRRLRAHAMAGGELAAIDAIALLGSGLEKLCDRTYAVVADRETRIARIMARDGIDREAAVRRIDAQRPDEFFIENCGAVLRNDTGETEFLSLCKNKFMEDMNHG